VSKERSIEINRYFGLGNTKVFIEFFGTQRYITKIDSMGIPMTEKSTVNDVLQYVRQQYPDLHLNDGAFLITVNNEIASLDKILGTNDTVSFIPFISGG
jgi:molybdopterin converting factor small subunit